MNELQSISVFGLGKLGSCIAATLAQRGFAVIGVDVDPEKVRKVNAGEPPVEEPLLAETIHEGRQNLRATLDPNEAAETDASFFIPPSPSLPDGSFSNELLLRAMQSMAAVVKRHGKQGHLFVVNSTTTPGSIRKVIIPMLEKETGWKCGSGFHLCYNPEFIALGNVINGLLAPDMVLIGESDPESGAALENLYTRYNTNAPAVARMSITSAELAKISVNSYITMKISFTNQLRLIAEQFSDANVHHILDAVGSDSRIGKKYLKAGLSYGGPCFPRDNRLLAFTARQAGLEAPLAEASDRVNELTKEQMLDTVREIAQPGETVAVLGLAYKPDTYIVEESAGLFLAQKLKHAGYRVLIHDPVANTTNSPSLIEFESLENLDQLKSGASIHVAAICSPDPAYRQLPIAKKIKTFDPWGML